MAAKGNNDKRLRSKSPQVPGSRGLGAKNKANVDEDNKDESDSKGIRHRS